MEIGKFYENAWNRYLDLIEQAEKDCSSLVDSEEDFGIEEYCRAFRDAMSFKQAETVRHIVVNLVNRAAKVFAPPGGKLEINYDDFSGAAKVLVFGKDQEYRRDPRWRAFSPEALWNELNSLYGGDKGADESYRQTANTLADCFNLKSGTIPAFRSGRLVLNMGVWTEKQDYGMKKTVLSYHSKERVLKTLLALQAFAAWAGITGVEHACSIWGQKLGRDGNINSRERFSFGPVEMVTYHQKFEFFIESSAAEQFQLFLSAFYFDTEEVRNAG